MRINTNRLNVIRYSAYASTYDWSSKLLENSREKAINSLNIMANDKILIIGAGTGLDLKYLPRECRITAIDITPKMIQLINLKNEKLGHHLTTHVMDGQQLIFEDETFDIVLLHLILTVIPDPVQTIQEAERVLKPGGSISVFDKFVPTNKKPSIIRKFFNLFTTFLFSNIALSFEPIHSQSNLQLLSDRKADLGGTFRLIQLRKN